jgi:hypothetical protein
MRSVAVTDPKTIYFPLASNAKALLAGASVATVRTRMKLASLLYDAVLLQSGSMHIQAGPAGASSMHHSDPNSEATRAWQTTAQRHAAVGAQLVVLIGGEAEPGQPSQTRNTMISSKTTIQWEPTFHPFAKELPPEARNWVDYVSVKPLGREANRVKDDWISRDKHNGVLQGAIPVDLVRSRVIDHANTDFAYAAFGNVSVSADALHMEVMRTRLDERAGWSMRGFALPILVPAVKELSWDAIVDLRKDKNIARLRSALTELESQTLVDVQQGADVEDALRRIYQRKLRDDLGAADRLGPAVARVVGAFVVGVTASVATLGLAGPAALALGGGASALTAGGDIVRLRRTRRSQSWIQALERVEALAGAAQ